MHALLAPLVVSLALGQATPAVPPQAQKPNVVPARALVPAIISGLSLIGGATFVILGQVQWNKAASLPTQEEVDAAQSNASSNLVGGVSLLGVGAMTAGLALVLFLWTPTSELSAAFAPVQGGGLFAFGWKLP
ncbi:MAG: hypothetical protein AMXMBFR34_01920 [Myxococcaceae bacterium]